MTPAAVAAGPRASAPARAGGVVPAAAAALCVLAGVSAAALFLPHQSLWHDEVVQMAGLGLPPAEQVRWLSGASAHDFGVGKDRMPPLSYWAGSAWALAFGPGEASWRRMGVAAVGMATLLIYLAARHAWGDAPALAAGLAFGVSPNVVVQAVEIRAYPLFLLASAATLYCLVRLLDETDGRGPDRPGWLAAMAACVVLASYTHFFGLVLGGAALLAALVFVPLRGGRVGPVLLACAAVGLLALGLKPFVTASAGISEPTPTPVGERVVGLARLGYRLVGHPATAVKPAFVALALAGAALAAVAAAVPKRRSSAASSGLLLALAAGGGVVAVAQLAQSKFVAATPSYNVWMLPALALWLSSGLAAAARPARLAAAAGLAMLLASDAYAARQLAVNGDAFAHTPYRVLERLVKRYGPDRVAVVHDGGSEAVWDLYAPSRYEFAGALRHYTVAPGPGPLRVVDYPDHAATPVDPLTLPADYLVVLRTARRGAEAVSAEVRTGDVRPIGDGPVAAALRTSPRWDVLACQTRPTVVLVDVDVFGRRAGALPAGLTHDNPGPTARPEGTDAP